MEKSPLGSGIVNTGTAHGIEADIKNQIPKMAPVKLFSILNLYVINIAGSIYKANNICHLSPPKRYCTIVTRAVKKSRYKKGPLLLKKKRLNRDPAVRSMVTTSKGFTVNK
tara:strand:- start:436 stop:768 length:333 start_codon:yes stop_codon:yes gene_type:complete